MKKKTAYSFQIEAEKEFGNLPHPKKWFEILSWVMALSTLQFLTEKTGSFYIKVIYYVSYAVLLNFIQKAIWTRRYQDYLPNFISRKLKVVFTYIIAATLIIIIMLIISHVVIDITKSF